MLRWVTVSGFDSRGDTQPVAQVDSAFYPPWDGKMSTSQRAAMFSGWGVKAVACLQVKLCVAISERFRKGIWHLKTLYKMFRFTFNLLYFNLHADHIKPNSITLAGSELAPNQLV